MVEAPFLAQEALLLPLVVRFRPLYAMTPDEFYQFCALNPDLTVELTEEGEVVFMSPSGAGTSARNLYIAASLWQWAKENGQGTAFDSSAGFTLPNKAVRAPDASWVRRERWAALTPEQQERFAPLCPDFVVELASPTDRLVDLQAKMDEYMANGAQLGWLIVPEARSVFVYRPGQESVQLSDVESISGEPILSGFTLNLTPIWKPSS